LFQKQHNHILYGEREREKERAALKEVCAQNDDNNKTEKTQAAAQSLFFSLLPPKIRSSSFRENICFPRCFRTFGGA